MASHPEFVDLCLELLSVAGAPRLRRMFGAHGVYVDDLFIAVIDDDVLYLKTDDTTRPAFDAAGCVAFTFGRDGETTVTSYRTVPAEAMESPALMHPWARRAIEAALHARAAKPASARRKPLAAKAAAPATPRKPKAAAPRSKTTGSRPTGSKR